MIARLATLTAAARAPQIRGMCLAAAADRRLPDGGKNCGQRGERNGAGRCEETPEQFLFRSVPGDRAVHQVKSDNPCQNETGDRNQVG